MNNRFPSFLAVICLSAVGAFASARGDEAALRERMRQSLVYLQISSYGYDQFRPWRNTEVRQKSGVGCAVGPYQIITAAWNLTDAALIQAHLPGKNEYIVAKVKVIDYEVDLALLEFEPNSAGKALKAVTFVDKFRPGTRLNYYWLSPQDRVTTGQGLLDRAEIRHSPASYSQLLNYVVTNTSQETGIGQVFCDGDKPVGIACWSDDTRESGVIPACIINAFLARAKAAPYAGFPAVGFGATELLDDATRTWLKMPAETKNGILVTSVNGIGTGCDSILPRDVILAIDGVPLDAYGRFNHRLYDRLTFHFLVTSHKVGDHIDFDVWREGAGVHLQVEARRFDVEDMLVPFYGYGRQPQYVITAGCVFQKLTRPYLANWGKDWTGKVTPHLYHYFRDLAFKPTAQRREVVILSYVLPAQINIGYADLDQLVVSKFNGMPISSIADIPKAQQLNPDSPFDVVEFELDNPTLVIPRAFLGPSDAQIASTYGIRKLVNIVP